MNALHFDTLPQWAVLAAHLAFGLVGGMAYFSTVQRSAEALAQGGSWHRAIAFGAGRLLVAGGVFALASQEGALPLLALALGFLLARPLVMHRREIG